MRKGSWYGASIRSLCDQEEREGVPGVVISIQTFGDLVNFHPHLHCLVTDGCLDTVEASVLPSVGISIVDSAIDKNQGNAI